MELRPVGSPTVCRDKRASGDLLVHAPVEATLLPSKTALSIDVDLRFRGESLCVERGMTRVVRNQGRSAHTRTFQVALSSTQSGTLKGKLVAQGASGEIVCTVRRADGSPRAR